MPYHGLIPMPFERAPEAERSAEPLDPVVRSPPPRARTPSPSPAALLITAGLLAVASGGAVQYALRTGAVGAEPGDVLRLAGQVVLLTGIALAVAGLGLLVFTPLLNGPEAAAAGFGSHRVMLAATAFAILLAALIGGLLPLLVFAVTGQRGLRNLPGFLAAAISVSVALYGVAYFRFIRPGVVPIESFGFGENRLAPRFGGHTWLAHLMTGIGGGIAVMILSGFVQLALRQFGVQQTQLLDFTWIRELPPNQFGLVWVMGAVVGPLVEEIFFRGLLFRAYLRTRGPILAYALSATLFALLHLNLAALPPILVLGLLLAWLYQRTGSLTPSVIAHAFNNGVAFLVLRYADNLPGAGG